MSNSRIRSIIRSYRSRVAAVRGATTALETVPVEERPEEIEDVTSEPPRESWKKDDIIDWLIDNGIEADRSDLVGMTKAELIDNFLDDES